MAVNGPAYAASWSGGKDSLHALHRAVKQGYRVTHLFNLYEPSSGRVRFHGIRKELIEAQADALGLELVQEPSGPDEFEEGFGRVLERLEEAGLHGVVFGNIHLRDVREWYEQRTRGKGLDHVEPLWGRQPLYLARGFLSLGYRALVVSVNLELGDPTWLGQELGPALVDQIVAEGEVDPCGERGEYHTFAFDGPLFGGPVGFRRGEESEIERHRFLDLLLDVDGDGSTDGTRSR